MNGQIRRRTDNSSSHESNTVEETFVECSHVHACVYVSMCLCFMHVYAFVVSVYGICAHNHITLLFPLPALLHTPLHGSLQMICCAQIAGKELYSPSKGYGGWLGPFFYINIYFNMSMKCVQK